MDEFIWKPSYSSIAEISYRTRTAQFGDGYKQVTGDGINNRIEKWDLVFNNTKSATYTLIRNFIDSKAGSVKFYWTNPDGIRKIYICGGIKYTLIGFETYDISLTFEEMPL